MVGPGEYREVRSERKGAGHGWWGGANGAAAVQGNREGLLGAAPGWVPWPGVQLWRRVAAAFEAAEKSGALSEVGE